MATRLKFSEMREKERLTRKKIIIDSALDLYSRQSIFDVRLTDIAKAAGVVPATLYNYFPTYEALMMEAVLKKMNLVANGFKRMLNKQKPETVESFAIRYVSLLLKHESTYRMLSYFMMREGLKNEILERLAPTNILFFELCSDVMRRNGITEGTHLRSRSLIAALNGVVMSFKNYCFNETQDSIHDDIFLAAKNIALQFSKPIAG